MQEYSRRDRSKWPRVLHLYSEYFIRIRDIVTILKPEENLRKSLSSSSAWVGDVLPWFASTVDAFYRSNTPVSLKENLLDSMSNRVQMLLGTNIKIPISENSRFANFEPNEYVISAYLNPRLFAAIDLYYGFDHRSVIREISRIFDNIKGNETTDGIESTKQDKKIAAKSATVKLPEDAWAERLLSVNSNRTSRSVSI